MEELFVETKVESLEGNKVKVTVTVDAADIDGRIKKTYKDFARKYNFPGFRKGKAPRPVIDNALGAEAVVGTVTEELLNGTWTAAIDEAKLAPVGGPVMETNEIVKAGEPYEYSFTIELRPEVELTSYEPVAIEMPFAEATDAEIDEQVEAMAEHYTDYEDASAATKMKPENYADLTMKATDADGNEKPWASQSFCVNGHNHRVNVVDKFDNGILYYQCADIHKRNYLLFTITETGYLYETIDF